MELILDLFRFMKERKKWIFMPVIVVLLLVALLIVFAAGSPITPFIYTIF